MKSIYFARHSFADSNYSDSDFEREISQEGFLRIEEQIELMQQFDINIDHLITSQAVRTQQTTNRYESFLNIHSKEIHYWLYESYLTQEFLEFIQKQNPKHNEIMVVGHNPTISFMGSHFSNKKNYSFYPGAILKLDFNIDDWASIELRSGLEDFYLK